MFILIWKWLVIGLFLWACFDKEAHKGGRKKGTNLKEKSETDMAGLEEETEWSRDTFICGGKQSF